MLPYFRRYTIIAYVAGACIPLALVTVYSWITGQVLASTIPGLLLSIALFVVCLLGMTNLMARKANQKANELVALYNERCDPYAFAEQGREVADAIQAPYTESGSWYLSFYALALVDAGQLERAATIGKAMQESAAATADPRKKAAILVNIEPLVLRLFGAQTALGVVDEAERLIAGANDADSASRRSFLAWERGLLEALAACDENGLLEKYSFVQQSAGYPLRVRVLDADAQAAIYRHRGDTSRERDCLRFVVEHGNRLPAVRPAQERLAQMGA